MMQTRTRTMTVAEFRAFTELPENRDKDFELLEGEVIEVPSAKKYHMLVVGRIYVLLYMFLELNKIEGTVVADSLDHILGETSILKPDVGFTSMAREPVIPAYPTIAPDLVVEVVSPSNTMEEFAAKMQVFFAHGTRLVWLVYPKTKIVHVYERQQSAEKSDTFTILNADDTITGGEVLPGFTAKVSDFFPNLPLADDAL
jgi:Uma2 family endonuclease